MKVIIPVAGVGSRLQPHTKKTNKCLIPIGGKPILDHIIFGLNKIEVSELVLIVGYKREQIKKFTQQYKNLIFSFAEQKYQLGLGHAIKLGLNYFDEPVLILLGDTIFNLDQETFVKQKKSIIGATEVDDPSRYGIIEYNNDEEITKFVEKPINPKSNLAQIGVYYISSQKELAHSIDYLIKNNIKTNNEIQLSDAFQVMLNNGHPFKFSLIDDYLDCGVKNTLIDSNKKILSRLDDNNIISPEAIVVNSELKFCTISSGCLVENSILENVILMNNVKLKNKKLKNTILS